MVCAIEAAFDRKAWALNGIGVVMLAIFKRGHFFNIIVVGNVEIGDRRYFFTVVSEEAAAEAFQELISALDHTPITACNAKAFTV